MSESSYTEDHRTFEPPFAHPCPLPLHSPYRPAPAPQVLGLYKGLLQAVQAESQRHAAEIQSILMRQL